MLPIETPSPGRLRSATPALGRGVFECAIAFISIESVRLPEATVGEIQVRPSIAVEVGNGYRCAEGGNVRLYVGDLWIERRTLVHEVNAGSRSFVVQHESGAGRVRHRANRPAIQPDSESYGGEKRDGNNGATNTRTVNHRGHYSR